MLPKKMFLPHKSVGCFDGVDKHIDSDGISDALCTELLAFKKQPALKKQGTKGNVFVKRQRCKIANGKKDILLATLVECTKRFCNKESR